MNSHTPRRSSSLSSCLSVAPCSAAARQPCRRSPAPRHPLAGGDGRVSPERPRSRKKASTDKGVTDTIRATLSDGTFTHDAQIQTVDIEKTVFEAGKASETNFKDTYRFNIGGYRLARLLGMNNVPMSVKRRVDSKDAAVTWWIDDVQFDEQGRLKQKPRQGPDPERTAKQIASRLRLRRADPEPDRNQGNLLWTKDWTLWLIDHTRAFRLGKDLMKPDQLIALRSRRCSTALRGLTFEAMDQGDGRRDEGRRADGRAGAARSHRQALRGPHRPARRSHRALYDVARTLAERLAPVEITAVIGAAAAISSADGHAAGKERAVEHARVDLHDAAAEARGDAPAAPACGRRRSRARPSA